MQLHPSSGRMKANQNVSDLLLISRTGHCGFHIRREKAFAPCRPASPRAQLLHLPARAVPRVEHEIEHIDHYHCAERVQVEDGAVTLFEKFAKLHKEYIIHAQSPEEELSQLAIQSLEGYFRSQWSSGALERGQALPPSA
jgi:hypothetical protein